MKQNKGLCACGSGLTQAQCCAPCIRGETLPQTAEALMRSRFVAYAQNEVDYLLASWFEDTRPASIALDSELSWTTLKIIDHVSNGDNAEVEFIASYLYRGEAGCLHERSRFIRQQGRWYYIDGEQFACDPLKKNKVGRNEPCPCGSGRKYKKCCSRSSG